MTSSAKKPKPHKQCGELGGKREEEGESNETEMRKRKDGEETGEKHKWRVDIFLILTSKSIVFPTLSVSFLKGTPEKRLQRCNSPPRKRIE